MFEGDENRRFAPEPPIDFDNWRTWPKLIKDVYNKRVHISTTIFSGEEDKVQFKGNAKECLVAYQKMILSNRFMREVVDASGWQHVCVANVKKNDNCLILALIERWWDTTHTFHLPYLEVGFTPLDFTAITGIPVGRGTPIEWDDIERGRAGRTACRAKWNLAFPARDYEAFCTDGGIRIAALKTILREEPFPSRTRAQNGVLTAEEIERLRAFFLLVIGDVWFPNNKTVVECQWLDHVMNVRQIGNLDWGTSIMAEMFYGLDRICRLEVKTMEFCWVVLQYWYYEHIGLPGPSLMEPEEDVFPRILRWAPERRNKKRK